MAPYDSTHNDGTFTVTGSAVRANTGETNPARIAHVPSGSPSHARADEGDRECVGFLGCGVSWSAPVDVCPECGRADSVVRHSPEAEAAITAELVACTLGQRRHAERLELRVDLTGRVIRMANALRDALRRVGAPGGDRTPDQRRVRASLYR